MIQMEKKKYIQLIDQRTSRDEAAKRPVFQTLALKLMVFAVLVLALNKAQAQSLEAELLAIKARAVKSYVREAVAKEKPNALLSREAVSSATVAEQIHAAVAGAIYGKEHIEQQRPYVATRSGRFWVVFGTLTPQSMGGTAVTVIRASNGEVMRVIHEQ